MSTYGDDTYGEGIYGGDVVLTDNTGNAPYVTCQPWITSDLLCCAGVTAVEDCAGDESLPVYPFTDDEYIMAVSNLLYNLTCQRFPGICTITTRPCITGCTSHPCGCGRYEAIRLPTDYRVWGVTDVTIDGEVVPPNAYEIVGRADLVRTDCACWPTVNKLVDMDCNTCGRLLEVTFITGVEPPIELRMAAADLVCELKKSCSGTPCALPERVNRVVRRGVEMEFADIESTLSDGKTGIKSVDWALEVHGCTKRGGRFVDPLEIARGF